MKNILLFDIDNTLLDFDKAEYAALGKIFERYQIADTAENRAVYSQENKALWAAHEAGKISREELLSTRFVKTFEKLSVKFDQSGWEIDQEYEEYLSHEHEFMAHAKELLDELRERHVEMYVTSNGTSKVSRPRILEAGISDYFQKIFISEEIGAHKPSKAFFDKVLANIEAAHEKEFTIVGDSLTNDILGGQNAGIHTIWYNPRHLPNTGTIKPEREIDDLLDVIKAISEQ